MPHQEPGDEPGSDPDSQPDSQPGSQPGSQPAAERVVVGAAVVRAGQVLAARRTAPPEAAGRWELPGGKVEAGESRDRAVVREVREELGCTVEVLGWLDGRVRIRRGLVLQVALARLVDGEPTPGEHDRLTWLGPEELDGVDWLGPDRPFLAELVEVLLEGERLPGGNVGGAVRVGDTVRRPTGPWTPAVHALLAHLAAAGLPGVPRVHGLDARGREVLDLLPGDVVDVDRAEVTERQLADLAAWTARLHDAVEDFSHPGPWRFFGVPEPTLVGHNDLAPYNVCFDGDRLAGVFDWDLAGPSTPLMELAHLAWNAVPLFREVPTHVAARRLHVLATAYAGGRTAAVAPPTAGEVLAAVPVRVQVAVDGIREAVRRGDAGMRALAATGEPERTEARLAALLDRMPAIAAEVGRMGG